MPAETGGILLGSRDDYVIQKFVLDPSGSRTSGAYDPDVVYLNRIVKEEWNQNGLAFIGFVHSHPRGVSRLSGDWGGGIGDIGYMRRIMSAIPALTRFLVPIVYSTADGGDFKLFPYVAHRGRERDYETAELVIIDGHGSR